MQKSSRKLRFQEKMAASPTTPAAEPISENYQIWRLQTKSIRHYETEHGKNNTEVVHQIYP